jgi:hypothetical protein
MNEPLVWALRIARQHTINLVADLEPEEMCLQTTAGEHHPAWTLGHLLLSDTYLLSLLKAGPLGDDFPELLGRYGPGASPTASPADYPAKQVLVERLTDIGAVRLDAVSHMTEAELAVANPDPVLARSQPTIAHHIQSLVFHEGYHSGKLSAWRKNHGLAPTRWVFA